MFSQEKWQVYGKDRSRASTREQKPATVEAERLPERQWAVGRRWRRPLQQRPRVGEGHCYGGQARAAHGQVRQSWQAS